MCTSISYRPKELYFGRTLDVDFSYGEQVVITPRRYHFPLRNGTSFHNQYALIGIAVVAADQPLYYEAANEKGLAMAGLRFPKLAYYNEPKEGMVNITVFELIPWILGQAQTVAEARQLLVNLNLTNIPFSEQFPSSPLHFMISDKTESIVVEPMRDGLHIHDNPYDVMTNSPSFDYHAWHLQQYLNLSPENGSNKFSPHFSLENYAVGMGALGLPGDVSSSSRFVRAAFHLTNSYSEDTEMDHVAQFFHVMDSVSMVKGTAITETGGKDITVYTCCINADKGIYYYKTYDNNQITAVYLHHTDLDADSLHIFDLVKTQQIRCEN